MSQPPNTIMRPPSMEDIQNVFKHMEACDIDDFGEADSDFDDLESDWSSIDLEKDAFLIFGEENALIAYAAIFANNNDFIIDLYVRAIAQKAILFSDLLAKCEARAKEMMANLDAGQAAKATIVISQHNEVGANQLLAQAYSPSRYHFQMEIKLEKAPQWPQWPRNYSLRTFNMGKDERMVYDFIQKAFAQPGRTAFPFDKWKRYMLGKDSFNPDLWFLLYREERLVGANLCFEYEEQGWVRQLGVAEAMRGQGIGSRLLQYSFAVFYEKGLPRVGLVVDSTRPNAQSVYENAGMRMMRRFDDYQKVLRE